MKKSRPRKKSNWHHEPVRQTAKIAKPASNMKKGFRKMHQVVRYVETIRYIFLIEQFKLEIRDSKIPDKEEKTACTIEVRYDYLDACLTVYPTFYTLPPIEQKETIVHELSHFITLLQAGLVDQLIGGKLVTEDHAREVLERENSWIERILCLSLKKELGL